MEKTDELLAVDTFFAGTPKGVGKVYIQTAPDSFGRYVWARLYTLSVAGENVTHVAAEQLAVSRVPGQLALILAHPAELLPARR